MGNFSGWLQRTENSAVSNALSCLVTDRTVKNKDVLNSFSSLLGNCHLMGHWTQKIPFLPIPVSLGKWGVSKLSKGRFCTCPSFPQLQFGSQHLFSVVFPGADRLSVLLVQQQSWGRAGWWHHPKGGIWSSPCPRQCWVTLGWRHCWRSRGALQSNAS